jgi:hypothetical protein
LIDLHPTLLFVGAGALLVPVNVFAGPNPTVRARF